MYSKGVGNYGEALAVKYLEGKGYRILARNFTSKMGEIDIVCRDKSYLVFVEVKYRINSQYGMPLEAINKGKIMRIKKTAQYYLLRNHCSGCDCRFDVIDILGDEIEHYENAF